LHEGLARALFADGISGDFCVCASKPVVTLLNHLILQHSLLRFRISFYTPKFDVWHTISVAPYLFAAVAAPKRANDIPILALSRKERTVVASA